MIYRDSRRARARIAVDRKVETQNTNGEMLVTWEPFGEFFADMASVSQREAAGSGEILSLGDCSFRLLADSRTRQIVPTWRVRYQNPVEGERVYNIDGVTNVDQMNRRIEIACSTGANDGR